MPCDRFLLGPTCGRNRRTTQLADSAFDVRRTRYEQPRGGSLSPRSISARKRRNSCAPLSRLKNAPPPPELTLRNFARPGPNPARSLARQSQLATDHPSRLPPLDARAAPRRLVRLFARFARRRVPEPGRHPPVPHSGAARMAEALCAETVQRGLGASAHEVLRV